MVCNWNVVRVTTACHCSVINIVTACHCNVLCLVDVEISSHRTVGLEFRDDQKKVIVLTCFVTISLQLSV